MFEHEDINKYPFDEIPLNQDCMLMSEVYMDEFSKALTQMCNGEEVNPYEVGYAGHVAIRSISENSIELSWYPNVHTRFHEVSISIPKEKIRICVDCERYDVKPYIFVEHEWLENLYTREYSVFALIDAIGVKNAIRENLLSKEKLLKLRDGLDDLAARHKDISFISFADSLILKSNWLVGYFRKGIECSYEPESFLEIIAEIQKLYGDVLGLQVYAVLTQGNNEYYEEPVLHISNEQNHICLNSLGVPFAELLAIESAAKKAIKSNTHVPSEVYMDEQYYHSLSFKYEFDKNSKPSNIYKAIMKTGDSCYFYNSCKELLENLRT
ncbi:hypothetical protein [Idiomarina abyssalis]|uniref:Uncharacterized protein n=1 Tax=Idiomarina abyssalis TaxID=86102 RepID=A0A8I1G925_9GAMM|nr:hypothetical protein [Idiomarina abyssalis]MBJ7268056.1 hypothetical protein [Idiomarina abyssalis]MBJ7272561.1 hypothetical protein [Idiomarina abyssalis]MBJ7316521.1 hypothetical protein [Idiomarina abyssalis]